MKNYKISYEFTQSYNNQYVFDFFKKGSKVENYIKEIETIDKIVENSDKFDIALDLINRCKNL